MSYLKRIIFWVVIALVLFAFAWENITDNRSHPPAKPASCPSPGTWVKIQEVDEFPYWECEYP